MPYINIDTLSGMTLKQKADLVRSITDAVVKSIDVSPDKVTICIREYGRDEIGKAGRLLSETIPSD
jgi:4-oxalocrotonate tautomerase family enzyme